MKYTYLFVTNNNGHSEDNMYFTCDNDFSQDNVNKMLLEDYPGATRIGTNFDSFRESCLKRNIKIYEFKRCYDSKKIDGTLNNIRGNY